MCSRTDPLDDKFDPARNQDEHSSNRNRPADKFGDGSSAAKSAARLPCPADPRPHTPALTPGRRPRLGLSLTQILGSTGAAVTAAFLGSRLGVAGTLIGAALASVISVVGGAIYTSSIKATKQRVAQAIVAVRAPDGDDGTPGTQRLPPLQMLAAPRRSDSVGSTHLPADALPLQRSRSASGRPGRPALRGALAASLVCTAVFAGALAVVTGYESVSGTALSGGQAGSLTILGGQSVDEGTSGRPATTVNGNGAGTTFSTSSGSVTSRTTGSPTTTAGSARAGGQTTGATTSPSAAPRAATSTGTASTTTGATAPTPAPTAPQAVNPPSGSTAVSGPSTAAAAPTTTSAGAPTTAASTTAAPTTAAPTTSTPPTTAPDGTPGNEADSTSASTGSATSGPDNGTGPR